MSVTKNGLNDLQPMQGLQLVTELKAKRERSLSISIPSLQGTQEFPKPRKMRSHSVDFQFSIQSPLHPQVTRKPNYPEESYGKKYQGLRMLERFVEGQEGVAVPPFKGISSIQMIEFISKHEPQVLSLWTHIGDLYEKTEDKSAVFLRNPEVIETLKKIQELIEALFEEKADRLPFAEESFPWLSEIAARNSYLMVRSSGMEDGEKSANAGNNLSVPYVEPNLNAVSKAAGKVVASNFELKSLKNLLDAKQNPFTTKLQLSFILQELIGEPISGAKNDGEIPRAVVLFTSEPTYSEDPFSVMTLSTAPGHGEAVVANMGIATDRCYITHSTVDPTRHVISYQNGFKPTRLVPERAVDGSIALGECDNPPHFRKERALDSRMLERLFLLGKAVERSQGKPMDMELVIKGETIYLVQARPIIRQPAQPSYVAFHEKTEALFAEPPMDIKRIVLGKASALQIEDASEICIAPSLEKAQMTYDASKHKVVIVGCDEDDNTHPWVNFSSLGVACLFHPNPAQVLSQLQKGRLIVCPQSERLYVLANGTKVEDVIEEGYVAHPARLSLAVAPTKNRKAIALPKKVRKALMTLKQARVEEVALTALETISQSHLVQRASSLEGRAVTRLEEERLQAMEEIRAAFVQDKPRLEKLYHIGRLESILGQKYEALESFSYAQLPAVMEEQQALEAYQRQLPVRAQFTNFIPVSNLSPIKELGEEWVAFLLKLEQGAANRQYLKADEEEKGEEEIPVENIEKMKEVISLLQNTSSMPLWLVRIFAPAWQKSNGSAMKCIDLLLEQSEGMDVSRVQWLQKFSMSLESQQKMGFQEKMDPSHKTFKKIANAAQSKEFLNSLRSGNKMEKLLAMDNLKKVIEFNDLYIKAIKANSVIGEAEKLKEIRELLRINKYLLWVWSKELFLEKELQLGEGWYLEKYFASVIDRPFSEQENDYEALHLAPSREFSVQAATMGSQTTYDRHLPRTTEDLFTLIHQNQLYLLSILQKQMFGLQDLSDITSLPAKFRDLVVKTYMNKHDKDILGIIHDVYKPQFMGIEVDNQRILVHFNVPMRNHSATFTLGFDKSKPDQYFYHCNLFGTGGRPGKKNSYYDMMKAHLRLFDQAQFLALLDSSFQSNDQSLSFTWVVPYEKEEIALSSSILMFTLLYEITESSWPYILLKHAELREEAVTLAKQYLVLRLQDPSTPNLDGNYLPLLENVDVNFDDLLKQVYLERDWEKSIKCISNIIRNYGSSEPEFVTLWNGFLILCIDKLLADGQFDQFVNLFSNYTYRLARFNSLFQIKNREILHQCFYRCLQKGEDSGLDWELKRWRKEGLSVEEINKKISKETKSQFDKAKRLLEKLAQNGLLLPDIKEHLDQLSARLAEKIRMEGYELDPKTFHFLYEILP